MSYSPHAVASVFTRLAENENKFLTQMQLQKLTYIAHGFKLGATLGNENLISETINAWKFGPVIPSLYHSLKQFRDGPVPPFFTSEAISDFDHDLIRAVYMTYGHLSGIVLSELTHKVGTPWFQAWHNACGREQYGAIIPDYIIAQYYMQLMNNQSVAVG